jgi:hypothetical protein
MVKTQRHPALGADRQVWRAILVVELRFAAGEIGVQVDHECHLAAVAVPPLDESVEMRLKFLSRIVSVEAKALVQADRSPLFDAFG